MEASSNSTIKIVQKVEAFIACGKRIMVLLLVPEPTRRNIQQLKDYPVFQMFFFDFRGTVTV